MNQYGTVNPMQNAYGTNMMMGGGAASMGGMGMNNMNNSGFNQPNQYMTQQ
jgi:hypothetical protein